MSPADVTPTARLLEATFPGSRVGDERYLRWLYDESPFGPVVETNLDDAQGRAGHTRWCPSRSPTTASARTVRCR